MSMYLYFIPGIFLTTVVAIFLYYTDYIDILYTVSIMSGLGMPDQSTCTSTIFVYSIFPGATEINFGLWFVFGLPTVLIILFIAWSYLAIIFCDDW